MRSQNSRGSARRAIRTAKRNTFAASSLVKMTFTHVSAQEDAANGSLAGVR